MPGNDGTATPDRTLEVAGTAASATLAVAAGGGPVGAALALGEGALGALAGSLATGMKRAVSRRFELWMQNVASALEFGSPDDVAKLIDEHDDQQAMRDELLQAFRDLVGALDEAVVPCVAALSAEHMKENRRPDSFRRRLGALLCELTGEDLRALHNVLSCALAETKRGGDWIYLTMYTDEAPEQVAGRGNSMPPRPNASYRATDGYKFVLPRRGGEEHLFALLKRCEFGTDYAFVSSGITAGPTMVVLHRPTIERVVRYLEPGAVGR